MYKVSQFLTMSEREYRQAGIRTGETVELTLGGHCLFDIDTKVPVIVRDTGCIGVADIHSITLTKNGSTIVQFELRSISGKSAEAAYILYSNQAAVSSDSSETRIPGLYTSRTNGPANKKRGKRFDVDDDDDNIPGYLK